MNKANKIEIFDNVPVTQLDEYDYLIAEDSDNEYVSINGPVEESSKYNGQYLIETSVGIVILDPDYCVRAGNTIIR